MILDLNADLGEGAGTDAEMMKYITSANVCCGMHAGGAGAIWETMRFATANNIVLGAHPGFEDRVNFGRKEHPIFMNEAVALVIHQLGALVALAKYFNQFIRYVKPHGALYHIAMGDAQIASAFGIAAQSFGIRQFVGLPDSIAEQALDSDFHYIREGFADRRYLPDGTLVPRSEPNAVIHDAKEVVDQVEWLVREKQVRTICVHGDTPGAVEFVRQVRGYLLDRGHEIKPFAG